MRKNMLDDARIDSIINEVMSELRQSARVRHGPEPEAVPARGDETRRQLKYGGNLFPDVDSAVSAAHRAYRELQDLPLSLRETMITHIRRAARESAHVLAQEAWQETGMGRYEDKVQKNLVNANRAPGTEMLDPKAWSGDHGLTLVEFAPYGVIGSIIPSTNPTSTVICNVISMVAAGNAVVFNAHPGAKSCSNYTVQLLNNAIVEAGGPQNLVSAVEKPTIDSAKALMQHSQVNLLVVTGGAGVVREALASGKRAVCAGPGNPPVVVDETADIDQAGRDIVRGASFDNNIVCIDEKEVFVVNSVADQLKHVMLSHGAVELSSADTQQLTRELFVSVPPPGKHGTMNKEFIGKNANVLLSQIGIQAGDEVRLIIIDVSADHPLVVSEQMMPILPIVRVPDANTGIDLSVKVEHGFRHTAVMHSKNLDHLSRMARVMDCSIFVKNAPSYAGVGLQGEGFTSFTIASPTGEGITNPISFSRIRRCVLKDSFRIV